MTTHEVTVLCPDCDGENNECETCDGTGEVVRTSPDIVCDGSPDDQIPFDDEPADIDDDRDFNPYTGAREDDGYDTGGDW